MKVTGVETFPIAVPSEQPGLGYDLREDVARGLRPDGPGPSQIRVY